MMGRKDRSGVPSDASGVTTSASTESLRSPSAILPSVSSRIRRRSGQKSAPSTEHSSSTDLNGKSAVVGLINKKKQRRSLDSSEKAITNSGGRDAHSENSSPKRRNVTVANNEIFDDDELSTADISDLFPTSPNESFDADCEDYFDMDEDGDEDGLDLDSACGTGGDEWEAYGKYHHDTANSKGINDGMTSSTVTSEDAKMIKGQKKRDRKAAKVKKEADKDVVLETQVESLAERAAKVDQRRKKNDDYVADLKHKGLHSVSGEIDRCLKKVSEGVETFEDIWQKVHNATNTNQKEKYEADLKKEIKKLQRLRDQIKSWIASGEIKDKSTLVDTRKLIETQMERFKVVERETKTKAYSKEGLGAAQKLDPTTREREDLNGWLIGSIDSMQIQMDSFESEIESILAAKKKKLDKDKQDRLDELKTSLERHRFHVGKLETLMRMLDNLAVDVNAVRYTSSLPQLRKFLSQVKKIKDDIDYYLESNQEPEFEENEFLYDDIEGLEEFDDGLTGQPLGGLNATDEELVGIDGTIALPTSGNHSPISPVHSSDASDPEKRRKSSDDSSKVVRPVAMKANHSPSPGVKGGVIGTPPKGVGTPNNSSPSSGLSNHVSSLSSLSSSPTHNYHNAKSMSNSDSVEHNNSSAAGAFTSGGLSKSPSSNSTSNSGSTEGTTSLTTVNGVLENGSSNEDHSSPHTQMISSSTPSLGLTGALMLENGLISPPPLQQDTSSSNCNNILLNSSSLIGSGGSMVNNNERSQHHNLFGDSIPSESTNSTSSSQQQHPSYLGQQTLAGFAAAAIAASSGGGNGLSNNLSESGFATNISNLGVSSSSSLISNSSSSNNNSSSVVLGGSSNVIGLTSIVGGGNQIQQNSAVVGGSSFNNSSVSSLVNSTTTTTSSSVGGTGSVAPGSMGYSSSTSNSISSSGGGSGVSSHNSNSGILSQQQLQQLQQIQHQQQQGPTSQSGNSRDNTPISDYLRLNQDQMLLNRILTEPDSMASLKSMAQDVLDRSGLTLGEHNSLENKMRDAHIPPLLGVAPLGPVPLQKEHQFQFQMLDNAHCHVPVSADSERMRQFLPRNPYPTPHYYPQNPLTNSDTLEFFQRLSIETLFFIFYYLEGTKAQFLAAKVLKKQSWRFHTKYMMWFQRHEEPKVINEEYEQGTYIYFDIEKWGQRKKDGFVFEYRYLEDRELG